MPGATWAIGSFLGGEISQVAQGRFDKPDYRFSMTACLNGFPIEIGAWTRRPGTNYAGHTKGGKPGRVIGFDFEASNPITLELTDGFVRFRNGNTLITGNDAQVVLAVSSANPAVVQTTSATTWNTGDTLIFPGASTPLLENRQFIAAKVDTTHFSLTDALTGATIDGSTLGALVAGATVAKVHELATAYLGGSWSGIRPVQAETTDILLTEGVAPQALTVTTLPSPTKNPVFSIGPVVFNDGPYLDPFTNAVRANPSGLTGIIALSLDFPAYDSTKAYAVGVFVSSGGVNYVSLQDQNVGHTPASNPTFWATTPASAAINNGQGFLGTDIGRLVRLLSEPPAWAVGSTYSMGVVVSYNPTGLPGAATYWSSLVNGNTGHIPGTDLTNWTLVTSSAAIWSWGKITSLSNIIDRALAGSTSIGNLTNGGGINSAFDGTFSKAASASAEESSSGTAAVNSTVALSGYVGKNYSGASAQKIMQATAYPSSDAGFSVGLYGVSSSMQMTVTLNLRAKSTAPASQSDGTLLGTTTFFNNTLSAVTVVSSDQSTSWNYVWIEIIAQGTLTGAEGNTTYQLANAISQISFFNPPGTGTGSGVNIEVLGPPLLYSAPIVTWRLGVYSDTTGYPTCGVYNDGRLFLGGAVGNRFDASVSNGINGSAVNFAPTDQNGVVSGASAISYTFNSDGVNPIEWMKPDLQGVLMGTKAGEWLVKAPTAGSISPTNITASNVTNHGGADVIPCKTEHTLVFVQRYMRKLLEYFPDVYSGKFSAPNLADKASHIVRAGVAELAYTSALTPIIWGRDALGALFGITYKRDTLSTASGPTFYGWHRHTLGSGRIVESICAGPSVGGDLDSLTMVTGDPTATSNVRHVEVLTDTQDEDATLAESWFLDDAVTPSSTTGSASGMTYNGLWHLNGKTVQVFAGGLDCGDTAGVDYYLTGADGYYLTGADGELLLASPGAISDFVVTNGSVFVPYGDGVSVGAGRGLFTRAFTDTNPSVVIGYTYTSQGQTTRPIPQADSGARNGPAFAKLSRAHRFGVKLVNTLGISFGGDITKQMYSAEFKMGDGVTSISALTSFTGIHQDALRDEYDYESGKLAWQITRPWPATVVAAGNNLFTQDQ